MFNAGDGGNGGGNGEAKVTLPLEMLIDRLELEFDRRDGMMRIGGRVCSDEVALMMLKRAVNLYEFRTRAAFATAAMKEAREAAQVNDMLARNRAARGA